MEDARTLTLKLSVNGKEWQGSVPANRLLVDLLRYDIGLTGTKEGCSVGVCGACTVMVDGRIVSSCLALAGMADGCEVTTVEGLASDARLAPVQQAFIEHGGFQCGICTPGVVVAAKALLEHNPDPTEEQARYWLAGNLCRCTGYDKIIRAVLDAAKTMREEAA